VFDPDYVTRRPELLTLKASILAHGGQRFQVDAFLEMEIDADEAVALLREGIFYPGKLARLVSGGRVNQCHDNTADFVARNPAWFACFGFALGSDQIWRVHSWALYLDGPDITRLAEVTHKMTAYYGRVIGGGMAIPSLAASAAAGHRPAIMP
jgi:hypothetical protein